MNRKVHFFSPFHSYMYAYGNKFYLDVKEVKVNSGLSCIQTLWYYIPNKLQGNQPSDSDIKDFSRFLSYLDMTATLVI